MMVAFNKEVAGNYTKECGVPARMLSYLAKTLEERDTAEELTFQFLGLYERFVLGIHPTLPKEKVIIPSSIKTAAAGVVSKGGPVIIKPKVKNGNTDSPSKSSSNNRK